MIQNQKLKELLMEYPLSRKLVCSLHGQPEVKFDTTVVEMVIKLDDPGGAGLPTCMSLFGCENFILRERVKDDGYQGQPPREWLELVAV